MDEYLYKKLLTAAFQNESVGLTPSEVRQVALALKPAPRAYTDPEWYDVCESANPDDPSRGPEPR